MVVMGGIDPALPDTITESFKDPWTNGINVFDLSAMRWKTGYELDDAAYQSPSVVRDWYAQDGPYPSWDYAAVERLFIKTSASTSSSPNPSTPPSAPTSNSTTSHPPLSAPTTNTSISNTPVSTPTSTSSNSNTPLSDKNTTTGAIAGGVVGVVVFLAVIAAVVCCILSAHLRRKQDGQSSKSRRAELEASARMVPQELMHRRMGTPQQELAGAPFPELSSGEERHEGDAGCVRDRIEIF